MVRYRSIHSSLLGFKPDLLDNKLYLQNVNLGFVFFVFRVKTPTFNKISYCFGDILMSELNEVTYSYASVLTLSCKSNCLCDGQYIPLLLRKSEAHNCVKNA
jgi:hypothetical protein